MSKKLPAPDPIDGLLEREAYRIRQMRDTLRLRGDGFDRLYMPVLRKFAAHAHLLPASEKHHHDGQGGLLSHSLEVSVGATRASSAFLYGHRVSPKYQDHVESQWRLAIAFSGLLHDCGKLFTGMKVTDASGMKKWNPYRLSLMDWLEIEKVDRYRILWEKSRFGNHEMLGAGLLHFFISEEIQNFLTSHDQSTWKSITETVAGHNDEEKFGALVRKEDHYSVATDLALNRKEPGLCEGQRPEAIVIQIMRDLLSDPRWSVNVPGSRLWHIEDSFNLVWKSAAADIAEEWNTVQARRDIVVTARPAIQSRDTMLFNAFVCCVNARNSRGFGALFS
jgi:conjugal transfer pilus assembly protein TraI